MLEQHWYRSSLTWVSILLLPLSWVFSAAVFLRRFFYQVKLKKSYSFAVPVIVVGNITVGGTGKTPLVIWLVNYLREQGFTPGIVSRGVGGKKMLIPRWITPESTPAEVGDEAILLVKRTQAPLVTAIDRVAAVQALLAKTNCNIVISDDGLQHYRLNRQIEIAVVDGERGLGNQQLLPAGPLRERPRRLQKVNMVLTQSSENNSFCFQLQGDFLVSVANTLQKKSVTTFKNQRVHAIAAIGNPQRFFSALRAQGMEVIEHVFPDHYLFTAKDIVFSDELPIIMTEKDAVKCQTFANHNHWYWPVEAVVSNHVKQELRKLLCVN